jgi:hypothetical protein
MTESLNQLIKMYPCYIPVTEAAAFLHMGADALRASIEQNRCPFGFCWRLGDRNGYKIPTIAFISWLTKGAVAFTV